MKEREEAWAEKMKASPFGSARFTGEMRQAVNRKLQERTGNGLVRSRARRRGLVLSALILAAACMAGIGLLPLGDGAGRQAPAGWEEQHAYPEEGKPLFSVYPEPEAKAGITQGYLFSFTAPFHTFAGKSLEVLAVHGASGLQETVLSETIRNPDSGYEGLQRHGMQFTLPLGGLWRLDVLLDGVSYGHVTIALREPDWEASPEFRSGTYFMRGVEGKAAFIDAGFTAGMPQKYMWHFWGNEEEFKGGFEVKALKEGKVQPVEVYSARPFLSGSLNGADRTAVTTMSLPEPGRWRLLPYVGGRLLDTIVVDVKRPGKE
ncbi:DUF4871 domain-containing protein [Paenibacillus humicus]|uniref:DUF4871 domain-containing protein n=1 Tax=Paenibacillus humicus TaxID=412861 RepID=UPI003F17916E